MADRGTPARRGLGLWETFGPQRQYPLAERTRVPKCRPGAARTRSVRARDSLGADRYRKRGYDVMLAALPLIAAAVLGNAAYRDRVCATAQQAYAAEWQANHNNADAIFGLAELAIYENRLADAQKW